MSNDPRHGRMSSIYARTLRTCFREYPNPMSACRYHSLIAEEQSLPQAPPGDGTDAGWCNHGR